MESPTYALFNAVEEGDVERVQQAMEAGANANPDDGRNAFQGTTESLLKYTSVLLSSTLFGKHRNGNSSLYLFAEYRKEREKRVC